MYRNNDLIYEATHNLERLSGLNVQIDSNRNNYDAILTINDEQFIVEAKSTVRNSNLGLVVAQLSEIKSNVKKPIVLVAEYISKNGTENLRAQGINYIDLAGNAFLKYNALFVFIEGQKRMKSEKTNQSRAFQEAGLKILFYLLCEPQNLQDSYRKISEKADVSIGSVSNVLNELEELNFLIKTNEKRVLKNTNELLERWIVEFNAVLRPRILRKRMRFIDPEGNRNWKQLETQNSNGAILWGGEPGGALLTNNLRPEQFVIFTDLELSVLAKQLSLVPDENGEIEVLQKFWKNDLDSNKVAPALLIYADLINSGFGRNIETAKVILENELRNI